MYRPAILDNLWPVYYNDLVDLRRHMWRCVFSYAVCLSHPNVFGTALPVSLLSFVILAYILRQKSHQIFWWNNHQQTLSSVREQMCRWLAKRVVILRHRYRGVGKTVSQSLLERINNSLNSSRPPTTNFIR